MKRKKINHLNIIFGNCNPSIDEGIVRTPVIQQKGRNPTKCWDLTDT